MRYGWRVGHALQLHGVALALDAGRGDHALALDRSPRWRRAFHIALTTAWMSCWCTTQLVEVAGGGVDSTSSGRVGEGDRDAGPDLRHQAGGVLELLDPALVALDLPVVDRVGEHLDLRR